MSLFKAREWWSTTSGYEEFHDLGNLCIGNLDNSTPPCNKIAVGSYQGLVRIYLPQSGSFSPDHLLMEHQTGNPVLQVEAGRFIQGSRQIHLAVLHPKDVTVYTLTLQISDDPSGADQSLADQSSADQYQLVSVYKNAFTRTACNMTFGPFGGSQDGDYICVQSMDGKLSFFFHETFAFAVFLPSFLTPGPLCYIARTDSIVTANSSRQLHCFKYQSLSMASSGSGNTDSRENAGRNIIADWTVNLGDHVISICNARPLPRKPSQLLILGERSVFCCMDTGQLRFMMKLEVNPSCVCPYGVVPTSECEDYSVWLKLAVEMRKREWRWNMCASRAVQEVVDDEGVGALQYLLATDSGQLQVFLDSSLVWAATLPSSPTDITVATFQDLKGVVVTLDELGHLACSYLGTDPSVFTAPPPSIGRELNYTEMEKEIKELQRDIRLAEKEGRGEGSSEEATLIIKTEIVGTPRVVELNDESEEEEAGPQKCVDIKLMFSSSGLSLSDVTTAITCSLPLTTHPSHLHQITVTPSPLSHIVTVVCTPHHIPAQRYVTLTTTFTTTNGVTRMLDNCVALPLSLFCQPWVPAKSALHKVTLDTNRPAVSLHSLFPSLLPTAIENAPPNAMGFKLLAGPELTIVASKSSERYRLQTDSFSVIGVFLDELITQLEKHYSKKEPGFCASYSGSLPLSEYFEIVDHHFLTRSNLSQCREVMRRQSLQFRAIQKRLLTRFKDKTPTGLSHLDTLLEGTYRRLMSLAGKSEALLSELRQTDNQLSCATQLINTLLRLSAQLSSEDYSVLTSTLSPLVQNSDTEQGWEEMVDVAVTHILRTTLAKANKDQSITVNILDAPLDNQRLKRHIALFCERIMKGKTLTQQEVNRENMMGATQSLSQTDKSGPPKVEAVSLRQKKQLSHKYKKPVLPALAEDAQELQTEK